MSKWNGYIIAIDPPGNKQQEALVWFKTSIGTSGVWISLADIPGECRVPGALCRIEWCTERWTQEELDRAKAAADRSAEILGIEVEP